MIVAFLPILAGAAMGLSAIGRMAIGIAQGAKARRINPIRPMTEIAPEIRNMLALRQQNLGGRMAGAEQAEQNIRASTAQAVANQRQGATDAGQLLGMTALAQASEGRAMNDLAAQEAQDYQRRLGDLERTSAAMASERQRVFETNELQPYYEEARTKAALRQASIMNTIGGLESAGNAAGFGFMLQQMGALPGGQSAGQSAGQSSGQSAPPIWQPMTFAPAVGAPGFTAEQAGGMPFWQTQMLQPNTYSGFRVWNQTPEYIRQSKLFNP